MFKWRGVLGEEREVSLNGVVFWMRRWGIFKWRGVLDEGMGYLYMTWCSG